MKDDLPVLTQTVITRDKLSIPKMKEIAEYKSVKSYNGKRMAYVIRDEFKELIQDVWGQYNEFLLLDMCLCERKILATKRLESQGKYHGTFLCDYSPYEPDKIIVSAERLLGYSFGAANIPVAIAAWMDIEKHEARVR